MFDEISNALGVECIETDTETHIDDMDNMGLGLGLPKSGGAIYDVAIIEDSEVDDDEEEEDSEVDDEEEQIKEIRRKVLKNMTKLVDSGMSALPHVIKEVKFTEDNKVFTSAANYISMMAKLNEQFLAMTTQPVTSTEIEKTKKGEKGVITQSTVTNNNIIMTANDVFDRLNNR